MAERKENTCARCGVPIGRKEIMCAVCAKEATDRTSMVPCRACGAANVSTARVCGSCGAPLQAARAPESAASEPEPAVAGLVGRRAELQVLEDCFDVCVEKSMVGGVIVTGEAGLGTSTLLSAFAERLTGRIPENRIFFITCRGDGEAFAPLRGVLRRRFGILDDGDLAAARVIVTNHVGKVLGMGSAALVTETAHLLGYMAGVPFPQSPVLMSLESDHQLLLKRLREAMVRFLEAEAKDGPVALIIDDLQKTTPESKIFMMEVFHGMGGVPVLVVTGGRPEIASISDNPAVVRIALEPLDDDLMRRLFSAFMPKLADPPSELVEAVVGRAAGNAGSMREIASLLIESGVVDTRKEPWTADPSRLDMTDMPVGLLDALKARRERLDPRDRVVLEQAAIVGEVFWDEAVVALARNRARLKEKIAAGQIWSDDSDGLSVTSSLTRLVERQFVVQLAESDIKGCVKYAFSRSGIRTQILSEMDAEERKKGHFVVALWLGHATLDAAPLFAEAEAENWERSGERHRAAMAYFRAARYARSRYLHQKAIKLFELGMDLADGRDRLSLADALHDLGSAHEILGEYEAAEVCFTEMLKHAWIVMHRGKAGAALNRIGRLYRARGDAIAARAFIDRGMALFKAAGDEKGMAACLGDLGELARRQGSYDRAFKLVSQALELQRKLDNRPSIAVCLHSLGHIEAGRGRYAQAERYLEEALDLRREAGDKGGLAQTLSALAIVLFNRGDLDKAVTRWQAALTLAEEVGDRRLLAILHNNLGEARRDQGNLPASMRHFEACEEVVTTLDDRLLHSEVSRNMGILAQKMGNLEQARVHLERSLKLAQEMGGKEMEALTMRALGDLAGATMFDASNVRGENEAAAFYEKALAVFRSIGNDFETARTLHAFGNRLLERGEVDASRARLEEARAIFQRIDSKAGDKVSRTIKEILDQKGPAEARAPQPEKEKEKKKPTRRASARKGKDPIPDMTEDLDMEPED
ncbi:MAG: tetratricopeptide repeat protein [Deltaproteobacteria bacterium]|nr:tetratricopeptide repeat protein [Deltaproteobacteria bacterium]